MKKLLVLFFLAWTGTACLQAQTVKLPTKSKKTTTTTSQQDVTPTKTESSTGQSGTLVLPTKKSDASTALPENGEGVKPIAIEEGKQTLQLPVVVRRQTAPRAKPIVKRPKKEDNEIYESAEHMPTYPGGASELMKFINENLKYPQEALADSIQGIVQVSFIVEKDGSTTDFEVLDEHHPALEAEAVRVLQNMPKWNPAKQNGVKVRVEYVVPVKFALSNQ